LIVHGGVKVYRGAPAAARNYVEADRSRADDYYLAEGTGIAEHLTVGPDGQVVDLAPLSGSAYEAWVAGLDPDTGEPRGRLRTDGHAVRFVEVVVNGPKSWSLAAELHPDVAAAYEAAQDRAARQIIGWLGQRATTRVGPRGAQVAVPVERLDAAVIRHYTSRAGDPHRHLHLQVNARVFAAGKWRGLDTVAFRDSIAAINGIGHAAVACDPAFRTALAAHGYTLNAEGEITQLAQYVGPFSKRATQIGALLDRYETEWRIEHPGQEPGPTLRRGWDARAWAEDRPDKVIPRDGREVHARWLDELHTLGYRDADRPIQLALPLPGAIDRDAAAAEVVARLGADRSAWNAADARGAVEQLLARRGIMAEVGVRTELAEDLTARALSLCVPLRADTPEHVRALTSQHVLDVEADLVANLAARGGHKSRPREPATVDGLDAEQRAAVAVLTGDAPLVVIEGAAGTGKTTTLAAVRDALDRQVRQLLVVTPTRKAAQVASAEVGTRAGSAAWLAHQYGWRWDETGTWTRLKAGDADSVTGRNYEGPSEAAQLRAGDGLLVDEAGMLDQDTARALLVVADETGARLALVGDRHQLPAVGRGGVLELACRWTHPDAQLDLGTVHRFTQVIDGVAVPDEEYAALSLAMRVGDDPATVFDALHARGQIAIHCSDTDRGDAIADAVTNPDRDLVTPARAGVTPGHAGEASCTVVVDTCEHAAALNAAIRDKLVATGVIDDQHTTSTGNGQSIGAGDRIVTRRNDTGLGVANRQAWTVTAVRRDGRLTITARGRGDRELPAGYVREHVELGYAATAYGAQGDTTDTAHLVLTEHTTAASAYVAMTRGRHANSVHLVADSVADAREQWIAAFGRDRADHGPDAARHDAEHAAAGYSRAPAPASPEKLAAALDRLPAGWDTQADAHAALDLTRQRVEALQRLTHQWNEGARLLAPLRERMTTTSDVAARAERAAQASSAALARTARAYRDEMERAWYADRPAAQQAARVIAEGSGRLGLHRGRVRDAQAELEAWVARWPDVAIGSHASAERLRDPYCWYTLDDTARATFAERAGQRAAAEHPDNPGLLMIAATASAEAAAARGALYDAEERLVWTGTMPAHSPERHLAGQTARLKVAAVRADQADAHVKALSSDPAITSQPDPKRLLDAAQAGWRHDRDRRTRESGDWKIPGARDELRRIAAAREAEYHHSAPTVRHGPSIGR
jgi:conjugative relaxase-like TrwC/TraI family protein